MHPPADGASSDPRVAELAARLREAEETLDAIRRGEVDAVIVGAKNRQQVYTLESADRPYRVLIEQMQEGAVTLSADGTILYCNRRFAAMLATPQERVIGGSIFRFIPATQRERFDKLCEDSAAGGGKGEFSLVTGGGPWLPAYLSFIDLAHEKDRILCGVVTDLTQQKQAEYRRRDVEESLQIALEAAGMAHWDIDLATRAVRRSPRYDAIFGHDPRVPWTRDAFINSILPDDRDAVIACIKAALKQGSLYFECRVQRANDSAIRWIRVNGRAYYDDAGKPFRVVGVVADITERRQLEDQLRQAQKMEAVGQLTGGLAHDFNNLLAVIFTSLELAQRRVSEPMLARQIEHAREAATRGAGLTRKLLSFSRRQSLQPRVVCINDLLTGLELLVQRAVGDDVDLQVIASGDLWQCEIDPHQLESAILNLAINARDAMPRGGRLLIETSNVIVSDAEAAAIPEASPGGYVKVSVIDTGVGITPEIHSRVFEPFFTTKEIGKGSGLGLSMVYGFVRQSNGHIAIESTVGHGTAVHLYLPCVERPQTGNTEHAARPPPRSEPVTVLVVEDDPHVRPLVIDLLKNLGHSAVEAGNGIEALSLLDRRPDIDLVFTDVSMPGGMSGVDLAREARRRRPRIAILLTTGFTSQSLAQEQQSDKDFRIIHKPYRREALADAINGALAEVREAANG